MILFQDSVPGSSQDSQINPAPNIIHDGHCGACNTSVNVDVHGINCWICKNVFHAINCANEKNCVSAPTIFTNQLLPAVNNSGAYEKRFGRFIFVCDFCMTLEEEKRATATVDRVDLLDKKIESMKSVFKSEIQELKSIMVQSSTSIQNNSADQPDVENVWNDKQRTDNLKHTMAIKKNNDGNPVCSNKLEKICIENGISVHKTFVLQKSAATGIVLNSKQDADKLKEKIINDCPGHGIEKIATKVPNINVVGLSREYTKDELLTMVRNQNPGITSLIENATSDEDKIMEVTYIAPLRKNPEIYRATIKVSNVIRSVIAKQNDRLFVGSKTCKVYDRIFVLRCYHCQQYGHHSKDCKNESACSHCAGNHETRSCEEGNIAASCVNCAKANSDDTSHEANSFACPIYVEHEAKAKMTIPFYQRK